MKNYIKTILSAFKIWVIETLKQNTADWNQEDKNDLSYIKNKPEVATGEDAIDFLIEEGILVPVGTDEGIIYTNDEGVIYTLS